MEDQAHTENLSLQDQMCHPVAFLSKTCGDVMYFAKAMYQSDGRQFVDAIINKVNGHMDNQKWHLIKGRMSLMASPSNSQSGP